MTGSKDAYGIFATKEVARIRRSKAAGEILLLLRERDGVFSKVSSRNFEDECLAAQLAIACLGWTSVCENDKIKDSDIEKAFLRAVMKGFESKTSVDLATAFSEYLHCSDAERASSQAISVARRMFQRLKIKEEIETKRSVHEVADGFRSLVESLDGFRSSFENGFEAFVESLLLR